MAEGRHLVGVDIGSSSIKVTEIAEDKRGGHMIHFFAREELPQQTVVDGQILNGAVVVEALNRIFHKRRRRDVALRASGHGVIIKKITVPTMTAGELAKQIDWEAEQHIPFDLNEVQIDYQVVRRWSERGQMDVLLVAAKKDEILDLTNLAAEARLRARVVDLDAFAVQNVFEKGYGQQRPGESIALVHVGSASTTINVVADGSTAFTRDISVGGQTITERIQRELGVTVEEAERLKCTFDRVVTPQEVTDIIFDGVEAMATEIQRTLDFYLATGGFGAIDRILVSGGSAKLPALLDAIGRGAGVLAEALDPLRAAQPDVKSPHYGVMVKHAQEAVVSVGLALRKDREARS